MDRLSRVYATLLKMPSDDVRVQYLSKLGDQDLIAWYSSPGFDSLYTLFPHLPSTRQSIIIAALAPEQAGIVLAGAFGRDWSSQAFAKYLPEDIKYLLLSADLHNQTTEERLAGVTTRYPSDLLIKFLEGNAQLIVEHIENAPPDLKQLLLTNLSISTLQAAFTGQNNPYWFTEEVYQEYLNDNAYKRIEAMVLGETPADVPVPGVGPPSPHSRPNSPSQRPFPSTSSPMQRVHHSAIRKQQAPLSPLMQDLDTNAGLGQPVPPTSSPTHSSSSSPSDTRNRTRQTVHDMEDIQPTRVVARHSDTLEGRSDTQSRGAGRGSSSGLPRAPAPTVSPRHTWRSTRASIAADALLAGETPALAPPSDDETDDDDDPPHPHRTGRRQRLVVESPPISDDSDAAEEEFPSIRQGMRQQRSAKAADNWKNLQRGLVNNPGEKQLKPPFQRQMSVQERLAACDSFKVAKKDKLTDVFEGLRDLIGEDDLVEGAGNCLGTRSPIDPEDDDAGYIEYHAYQAAQITDTSLKTSAFQGPYLPRWQRLERNKAWADPEARSNAEASAYLALPREVRHAVGGALSLKAKWDFDSRRILGILGYQYSLITGGKEKSKFLTTAVDLFFKWKVDMSPDHPVRAIPAALRKGYIDDVRNYISSRKSHYKEGQLAIVAGKQQALFDLGLEKLFAVRRKTAAHTTWGKSEEGKAIVDPLHDEEMKKWDAEWIEAHPGDLLPEDQTQRAIDRNQFSLQKKNSIRSKTFDELTSEEKEHWYAQVDEHEGRGPDLASAAADVAGSLLQHIAAQADMQIVVLIGTPGDANEPVCVQYDEYGHAPGREFLSGDAWTVAVMDRFKQVIAERFPKAGKGANDVEEFRLQPSFRLPEPAAPVAPPRGGPGPTEFPLPPGLGQFSAQKDLVREITRWLQGIWRTRYQGQVKWDQFTKLMNGTWCKKELFPRDEDGEIVPFLKPSAMTLAQLLAWRNHLIESYSPDTYVEGKSFRLEGETIRRELPNDGPDPLPEPRTKTKGRKGKEKAVEVEEPIEDPESEDEAPMHDLNDDEDDDDEDEDTDQDMEEFTAGEADMRGNVDEPVPGESPTDSDVVRKQQRRASRTSSAVGTSTHRFLGVFIPPYKKEWKPPAPHDIVLSAGYAASIHVPVILVRTSIRKKLPMLKVEYVGGRPDGGQYLVSLTPSTRPLAIDAHVWVNLNHWIDCSWPEYNVSARPSTKNPFPPSCFEVVCFLRVAQNYAQVGGVQYPIDRLIPGSGLLPLGDTDDGVRLRQAIENIRNPALPLPMWSTLYITSGWPLKLCIQLIRIVYCEILEWLDGSLKAPLDSEALFTVTREMAYFERACHFLDRMKGSAEPTEAPFGNFSSYSLWRYIDTVYTIGYIALLDRYLGSSNFFVWREVSEDKRGTWKDVVVFIGRAIRRMIHNRRLGNERDDEAVVMRKHSYLMGGLISQDAGWFKLMTSYGEPAGLEQALHSPVLFDSILTTNTITGEEWDTMTNADIVGFALCTIGRLEQSRFELRAGNSTSFDTVALLERFRDVNDLPPASKQTDGGVFMPIWEKIFEGDIDIDTLTPENVFGKCIKRVPASDAENALDERDVGGRPLAPTRDTMPSGPPAPAKRPLDDLENGQQDTKKMDVDYDGLGRTAPRNADPGDPGAVHLGLQPQRQRLQSGGHELPPSVHRATRPTGPSRRFSLTPPPSAPLQATQQSAQSSSTSSIPPGNRAQPTQPETSASVEMDSRKDSRPQGVESSTSNPVHDTVVVPSRPSPAMGSSQIQGRVLPPLHQMLHGVSHGVADSVAIAPASQPRGPRNIQSGLVPPPTSSQLPRELLDYGNDSVSMQRSWESNSTYGWGAGIATGQSSTRGASNAPYPGERLIPLTQAPSGGHGLNMPSSRASFPSQSFTLSQWRGTESRQGTPWEPNMPSPHVRPATAWDPAGPWRSWGPPAQRQVPSFTGTPRTEFRTFAESQMPMIGMPSTQSTETASIWRGPSSTGQTGRSTNAGGVYQEHYTGSGGPSTSYLPSQSQHPMLTYSQGAPQPLDSREELRQYGNPAQRRIVSVPGDRYTHIVPNAQSYNPPPPFFNPPPQSAQLYLPPPSASHTHRSHPFLDGLTNAMSRKRLPNSPPKAAEESRSKVRKTGHRRQDARHMSTAQLPSGRVADDVPEHGHGRSSSLPTREEDFPAPIFAGSQIPGVGATHQVQEDTVIDDNPRSSAPPDVLECPRNLNDTETQDADSGATVRPGAGGEAVLQGQLQPRRRPSIEERLSRWERSGDATNR